MQKLLIKLSEEDMMELREPFYMEEIKGVLFGLKHNKAAGRDGLPADFYQVFWEVVKDDLKEMLMLFIVGTWTWRY
jgi:hypothetical protein